ncbi:MAG: ArnT family glycosyltransferase, partial [Vicinamibacterales bacterium]
MTLTSGIGAARLGVITVCVVAVGIGAVGITDEGYVSLHGDMPKHLMNGVFLFDVARDRPFGSLDALLEYAQLYYSRYPALSLGHHPPLLAMAEVPAYALFGVSVFSARLVGLLSFVVAAALLYQLVHKLHGTRAALLASALFVTSPYIVFLTHSVLSEILALGLVMVSAYYLYQFCEHQKRGALIGFAVSAVLSLAAKQIAFFVFPAFVFAAVARLGVRRFLRRDVLLAISAFAIVLVPLAVMTFKMSPTNIATTIYTLTESSYNPVATVRTALTDQFALPVILLIGAGLVRALVVAIRGKDRTPLVWVVWAGSVLAGMLLLAPYGPARFSTYWVPALCALAAIALTGWRHRVLKAIALVLAVIVVGAQARVGVGRPLSGAEGFEEAARVVLASNPGPTVLFSGHIDTGFFTFFIRKHDAERRLVVLRADKVLTTSFLGRSSVEERITERQEIYGVLQRFGTRHIVIEDRPSGSRVLEW